MCTIYLSMQIVLQIMLTQNAHEWTYSVFDEKLVVSE